ncbi:hypothetical protein J3R30DRAFT_3503740 [Lentinula aciculospora]|uniref:Uncharacterized protein n=1 Tax=Lentinula aciculospora TaxID=153920 RepID=A0A9W9DLN8_9AGAR|nr:hypothetical protein J3R30DRAFT_3503740 [Lentinula aciculospora]
MILTTVWKCIALCLVSIAYAAPLIESNSNVNTVRRDLPLGAPRRNSAPSVLNPETKRYTFQAIFMIEARGRAAHRIQVTPSDDNRVTKLIQRAAQEKWGVYASKISVHGNVYSSYNEAIPFKLEAPFSECKPQACEGEALNLSYNSEGKLVGSGKIFSTNNPRKIIYDSANTLWKKDQKQ